MFSVIFLSDKYSQIPAEDSINDVLGRDLSEWLRAELAQAGFDVGEVIAEDYAYGFWIKLNRSHYWITQGGYESGEYENPPAPEWLISVDYDPGCLWWWRLRARPNPEDPYRIASAVHNSLLQEDHISNIQWWRKDVKIEPPALSTTGI